MRGRSFESTVLFSSDFFNENEGETSSLPSFCVPICKIEDRCHVMDQSVIIIRRTFLR